MDSTLFCDTLIFGSWDNWENGVPVFNLVKHLPCGTYQYKFMRDNVWFCDNWAPKIFDSCGNENNLLTIVEETPISYNVRSRIEKLNGDLWYDETFPSGKHFEYEYISEHYTNKDGTLYYYYCESTSYGPPSVNLLYISKN